MPGAGAGADADVGAPPLVARRPPAEARARQRHVGAGERRTPSHVHDLGVRLLALRAQRLDEPGQRPAVLAIAAQVLPEDRLGLAGTARFEQHRAERVPRRVRPLGRLGVDERVLQPDRAIEVRDGGVEGAARRRDLAGEHRRTDRHDGASAVGREQRLIERGTGHQRLERRELGVGGLEPAGRRQRGAARVVPRAGQEHVRRRRPRLVEDRLPAAEPHVGPVRHDAEPRGEGHARQDVVGDARGDAAGGVRGEAGLDVE